MSKEITSAVNAAKDKVYPVIDRLRDQIDTATQTLYAMDTQVNILTSAIEDEKDAPVVAEFLLKAWDQGDYFRTDLKDLNKIHTEFESILKNISSELETYFKTKTQ